MSNKAYDILKWVAMVALPATIVCAGTIMAALNVDQEIINTTIQIATAVNALLGTLLGISVAEYHKKSTEVATEVNDDEDIH